MNRLHHIRKTLPKNITDNRDYPELEFVVVDYNSNDGLEEWLGQNMRKELESGLLKFYSTDKPKRFLPSHSKNIAHHLSTGDIVCNVDADNFTGAGFAEYLNIHFLENSKSFSSVDYHRKDVPPDTFGRIALPKKYFLEVGGYDERMLGYGYEDIDLCERLKRNGLEHHYITNRDYFKVISHSSKERINQKNESGLETAYINYIHPLESELIILFEDDTFVSGTLLDLQLGMRNPTLKERKWLRGTYQIQNEKLHLSRDNEGNEQYKIVNTNIINSQGISFYKITERTFLDRIEMQYYTITNHEILLDNMESGRVVVNNTIS